MNQIPPYRFDDVDWKKILESSVSNNALHLPRFPSDGLQAQWVGRVGVEALREVWPFYQLAKSNIDFRLGPVLDFGVGWGRVARFFLNDLAASEIYGADTSEYILDECKKLGFEGQLFHIEEMGSLPFPDEFFSGVVAYSVFTHLSRPSADHWIKEIRRVLNPRGRLIATIMTDHFIGLSIAGTKNNAPHWMKKVSGLLGDPVAAKKLYDEGEYVWQNDPIHNHPHYGWAAVPKSYIERYWKGPVIEFVENLDFDQGAFVI